MGPDGLPTVHQCLSECFVPRRRSAGPALDSHTERGELWDARPLGPGGIACTRPRGPRGGRPAEQCPR